MPYEWNRITVDLGLPELSVKQVEEVGPSVTVWAEGRHEMACCPGCGAVTDKVHDRREVTVEDVRIGIRKTFLKVTKRRFRCGSGCPPFPEEFGCLGRYKRQTKRLRTHLEEACRHSSVMEASRKEAVGYKQLDRLYYEKAKARARDTEGQELPEVLGVDEFSGRRGGRLHVTLTDVKEKRLWEVLPEKSAETFIGFFKGYSKEARERVIAVVHDMDQGWRSWTRLMFGRAIHVVDKFHVVADLLRYLEDVRKTASAQSTSSENREKIRKAYYLIRKRRERLTPRQKVRLEEALAVSSLLKKAYEWKEAFCDWYDTSKRRAAAETDLNILRDRLEEIAHLKRFSWVLENWGEEILNFFVLPVSNGFTEGMNNKIKTLKRQAYGFRNFERFRARILTECAWH